MIFSGAREGACRQEMIADKLPPNKGPEGPPRRGLALTMKGKGRDENVRADRRTQRRSSHTTRASSGLLEVQFGRRAFVCTAKGGGLDRLVNK